MTNLKAWCESKWEGPLLNGGHGNVFTQEGDRIRVRGGTARNYKSKEQKAYEARFAIYNKKLAPVILAEATQTMQNIECVKLNEYGRPIKNGNVPETEVKRLPVYRWPAHEKAEPVSAESKASTSIPRKRVSRVKLAQAQEILSKVPQHELAGFLARFGLSMSLAASIASLDNVEQIARQFLRATL